MRQIKTNNINNKNDDSVATHSVGNKEGKTVKKSALLVHTPRRPIDNSVLSCWCVRGKGA